MKRVFQLGFAGLLLFAKPVVTTGQAPQSFNYQSVARNESGIPITETSIGLRISIHNQSETGTILYQETHTVTTNLFGLFTLSVGGGIAVSGSFPSIDWGAGAKFLEVEADFHGGTNYVSMGASQLLSVPYALHSENGTPGPQGPQGAVGLQGVAGPQGLIGSAGQNGTNGLSILSGSTNPASGVGVNGEFFINTSTNMFFGPKANGTWPIGISIVGPTGLPGANGSTNGFNILNGTTDPPTGTGVNGEFYINTTSKTLFGPKANGIWPAGVSLIGPVGPLGKDGKDGTDGVNGSAGTNGTNGLNVLNGTTDPASGVGVNGEFYINTSTNKLFGPKAGAVWPAGVSFVGPTGTTGSNGTNGLNVLNGTTNPTAGIGVNGEFYINTSTNTLSGPKAGGAWPAGVSLVGPSGPSTNAWSLTGNAGTLGGTNFIGTTDNQPFDIRTNSMLKLRITTKGQLELLNTGNSLFIGEGSGASEDLNNRLNVFIGSGAGASTTSGYGNIATGLEALYSNTTGTYNTAYGLRSLNKNTTGYENIAIGNFALYYNTTGNDNIAIGVSSLYTNSTGAFNVASGYGSMHYNTTGSNNIAQGYFSNYYNTTGSNNTTLGHNAGTTSILSNANITGSNNTFIGYNSGPGTITQLTNATAIGYESKVSANNSLVLGGTGANAVKVGIGTTTPVATLDVTGTIEIVDGTQGAGKVLTSDANGLATWITPSGGSGWGLTGNASTVDGTNFIGTIDNVPLNFRINNQKAGKIETDNVFLGFWAGLNNTTGDSNVGIGKHALVLNTAGYANTAIGHGSLNSNTTGKNNTALGTSTIIWNTTGQENTTTGAYSMFYNTTGQRNTASGYHALHDNTTGNNNTAIGWYAGWTTDPTNANITGSNNTFIGYNSGPGTSTQLTNATAIGYSALVSASNSLVLGGIGAYAVNVGIGVIVPTAKLDVAGTIKIADGTQGSGKVLTSDANGLAIWSAPAPGGGWGLSGNAGTVDGTNFIGTTDNVAFNFKVNNANAGKIDPSGPTFFGYQAGNVNTGLYNSGIGYRSLYSNTTGSSNTATGYQALYSNTTGMENTAIGYEAMFSNSTGNFNTAYGRHALYSNTSAGQNTAIGHGALEFTTTGFNNTAIGRLALNVNTTGSRSTAIGMQALQSNTSGTHNTAIGESALFSNTTGANNTAFGHGAFFSGSTFSNSTAIGSNAQVTASNMIRLGDDNVTSINGAVDFAVVSDARFKKDITEDVSGLPFIMKLRPVTYHLDMERMALFMKTPENLRLKESENAKEKVLQTGFIAQEVEKAAKGLGYDFSGIDRPESEADYYGLRYAQFTVPLVKAVQEQQKMIDDLKAEVETLKSENTFLKGTIEQRLKKIEEVVGASVHK